MAKTARQRSIVKTEAL